MNPWTDAERRQCRRLAADKWSHQQIADALGRTTNGVVQVLRKKRLDCEALPGAPAPQFVLVGSDSLCQSYVFDTASTREQADARRKAAVRAGRSVTIYERVPE